MKSLASQYQWKEAPAGSEVSTEEVRRWVTAQLQLIDRQLEGGVHSDPGVSPEWFKTTVQVDQKATLSRDHYRPHVRALHDELRARGWNIVENTTTPPGYASIALWALRTPLVVAPAEGTPFHAAMERGEDVDTAVRRIVEHGTWHYLPGGSREFIPPHRIAHVLHGSEDAASGE
jgi:hypothetical protein